MYASSLLKPFMKQIFIFQTEMSYHKYYAEEKYSPFNFFLLIFRNIC